MALPAAFVSIFLLIPLALSIVISFWERAGFKLKPAFTLASYTDFLGGVRLVVLERSLVAAGISTAIGLAIAYPIAYYLARHMRRDLARSILFLFSVPFLVNYVIRTFAWTYLLGRTGPINEALQAAGLVGKSVDWLLFSDFSVQVGFVTSYMPFMVFPLWLSISGIDRRLTEASWILGAHPWGTFLRITLPLSLPGIFAAAIFGFVGAFGDSAVPIILGGVGYQMIGNSITSTLDVLNYPLAAAMSSVVILAMLLLLGFWFLAFDLRSFLGKIVRWRV
ncbi:spermidine/putrescine ABC transporter permease [Hypericibacter terrae]|uniref:Spermidine/putrescine ABC transporter permease n=2 Tax=Hypericibacter terrae TaxID=2602015 RepID=A0A5J6MJ35_9PROT|nr:spermidine/putrescine ABC transporter permease [Hypericibacter terrae]